MLIPLNYNDINKTTNACLKIGNIVICYFETHTPVLTIILCEKHFITLRTMVLNTDSSQERQLGEQSAYITEKNEKRAFSLTKQTDDDMTENCLKRL